MFHNWLIPCAAWIALASAQGVHSAEVEPPAWTNAYQVGPPTADQTKDFMQRLARFAFENHLKNDEKSQQRGMLYEYLDVKRKGQSDQFVQGEALDTMHDGAWFAAAMVNAYRATGDKFYKDFLTQWQLPFYLKMLNHSDTLFSNKINHARPQRQKLWSESKEWLLQEGEKGFVPYWWDDGGSVSLERRLDKNPLPAFPSFDQFIAESKPNPQFLLSGYCFGSSNHMAQDLGVMLQLAWLLLKDSQDETDRKLAAEVAEGCKNLYECRMRHHGHIPMSDGPWALAGQNAMLLKDLPDASAPALWKPSNTYVKCLYDFAPGARITTPGFADDMQYRYYAALARHDGKLPKPMAFKTIYDAYTERLLYRYYSDDAPVPPGINRFDLHPYTFVDGKPTDYRSDHKGPSGKPRPIGSRMGPQTMIVCGWALQALREHPGIWEEPYKTQFAQDARVCIEDALPNDKDVEVFVDEPLQLGPVLLGLRTDRQSLMLAGGCVNASATIKIYSRADAKGSHTIVHLTRGKPIQIINDRGEPLKFKGDIEQSLDRGFNFEISLPYTVVKGQKPWANAIEHGRLSVQIGDQTRNLYFASSEGQVRAHLERELAGGLRTWDAIFREWGYIPTGIAAGSNWENFSDVGGYAHLISAAAQWLSLVSGKESPSSHR